MDRNLSLKGSTRSITEFFEYCINSILFQRGVYPPEDFSTVRKYELSLLRTHDDELKDYLRKILSQVHRWLLGGKCNKLVLCIVDKDDGEVVERWQFDVTHFSKEQETAAEVTDEETRNQMRTLIKQITASVTFLPELVKEGGYTFTVLAYTDADAKVPLEWGDSDSKEVKDGEIVQFRSFETNDHRVGAQVSYKI
ncbi:uncharacterized protein GVI51_J01001 [Nakaseomyces glabratus]|uniref:HORMA domain-containing protein n=2 Tax=Candida glabrata TaxID=5478 RepID=Q6FPT5_CANGA|nr:uncharacterized protein CAGL0J01089g [Nakaseomyces glabratus]KAH7585922.1 HORMA domain [Nakaseomyces glabratus]KAH7588084.1 HORMA domain [Nakaseomyces glabratus]KAH7599027.1 HORMA domain [Nakaseomyces glabratus]KAH7603605.1 HORMA domain [Nakaseomyces glabratus]KAI8385105.1 HORMA domain [Nakaseomyces glabratus]|eukprot:XP_447759.1 uncharacterized protein CAGL0J01089g [[Candida] glabrata]